MAQTVLKLYFKSSINPLPIGQLSFDEPEREDAPAYFVYDPFWLANGFPLSRDVPLIPKVFKTGLNQPVFGFMYDLIPGLVFCGVSFLCENHTIIKKILPYNLWNFYIIFSQEP